MQVRNIFFWCLLVSNYCVFSQTKIKASYYFNNNNAAKIETQLKLPTQFNDSIQVQQMANQILLFCMQKSYILTEVNPYFIAKDSVHFIVNLNQSFKWLKLKNIEVSLKYIKKENIK